MEKGEGSKPFIKKAGLRDKEMKRITLPIEDGETVVLSAPDEESQKREYLLDYCTDRGIKRSVNQDACGVRILKTASHTVVLAVVCDGVGGLEEGEYVSHNTVSAFHHWFDHTVGEIAKKEGTDSLLEKLSESMKDLIKVQNEAVFSYAGKKGIQAGTTLTAMLIADDRYCIAQIGDSRAYWVKDEVRQLTEDQSLVAQEIKAGRLTPEEAKKDKRRNVILQCLGATPVVDPVYVVGEVKPKSTYFLCSDGFVHELDNEEMAQIMSPAEMTDLTQAHKRLLDAVERVKKRGEKDNITVVLIRT